MNATEVPDVAQDAFIKLWRHRGKIRARSSGEWYLLVRTAVFRACKDRRLPLMDELDEDSLFVPVDEMDYLDALVRSQFSGKLQEAVDRLWLGELPADAEIASAALHLVLIDGFDKGEVARMFGIEPLDIDGWIFDRAILAHTLFAGLCWSNDSLANYVLGALPPLEAHEMDALVKGQDEGRTFAKWTVPEVQAVLLRVRNGLQDDQLRRRFDGVKPEIVVEFLQRLLEAYPYRSIAQGLVTQLSEFERIDSLSKASLWKRIVFEYHSRRELPHKQILERAGPAAEESGFRLNDVTLNNWIGLGRLWSQLSAFVEDPQAVE